jgi:hypothetical protein
MADYLPQASTTGHGHEDNTLVVKGLIVFAVVLVAVGIVVELSLVYIMKDFSQEERALKALAPPGLADVSGTFPAPRLQAQPPVDLTKLKQAELQRLNEYGWVDQSAGIAHIPIDRAMEIVASKGLAASGVPAEKGPAATPPPKSTEPGSKQDQKP